LRNEASSETRRVRNAAPAHSAERRTCIVGRLTPPGTTWFGESNLLQIRIHGNKPKNAYENASAVFERWLHDLEERGFTVHKDYEFPRGLRDEIDEADRRPW
jgi:hypothetical protein